MSYYEWVTLSLSIMIIVTRALPFLLANYMNAHIRKMGDILPAYITLLLVFYEIKMSTFVHPLYGLPELLSLMLVLGIHLYFRQILLSILTGTVSYLLIIHLLL